MMRSSEKGLSQSTPACHKCLNKILMTGANQLKMYVAAKAMSCLVSVVFSRVGIDSPDVSSSGIYLFCGPRS